MVDVRESSYLVLQDFTVQNVIASGVSVYRGEANIVTSSLGHLSPLHQAWFRCPTSDSAAATRAVTDWQERRWDICHLQNRTSASGSE